MRYSVIVFEKMVKNELSCSQKVKLLIIMLLLSINMTIGILVVLQSAEFMIISTDSIEIVNNSLSAFVLIDIDQMLSVFYSNWTTTYFNQVTFASNFMQAKSTARIETTLHTLTIIIAILMTVLLYFLLDTGIYLKEMSDATININVLDYFLQDLYIGFPVF